MSKKSRSQSPNGRASGGGFTSRSQAGGFFMSLKSLIWPVDSVTASSRSPGSANQAGALRSLPAMPRPQRARVVFPAATREVEASPQAHPLRRVAGSAGRWKKRVGEAKRAWSRATVDELIATDGHVQKLAVLVQDRYGLSQEAAELQVRDFLGPRDAGR